MADITKINVNGTSYNIKDANAATSSHTHSNYVPTSRTVNGKALSANISLTAADVGAAASNHTHTGLGAITLKTWS